MTSALARPSGAPAEENPAPLLELRGVTCSYPGTRTPALADVDFRVESGEIVAVMGASGAGKSTLVHCLTGIVPRYHRATVTGERLAFGRPLDELEQASLARRVGVIFQDFEAQLFSTNAALEVGFALQQQGVARETIAARTTEALRRVGLAGFERRDPATLSGGEKQRLALAGILALEPSVVLLDEPTTDIDLQGKRDVLGLLAGLRAAGVAVVIVEHEILAAEAADRLVLLAGGRVVAAGPSAELCADVELLRACGVRPRDLDVVRRGLGLREPLPSVAAAEEVIRGAGRARVVRLAEPSVSAAHQVGEGAPVLEARDVCFTYEGGTRALDGVSLRIGRGELVALVGRNGSGKTTLAKHLNGLLRPTSGAVLLDGVDTRTLSLGAIARRVGFVFQDPDHQLFCASVREEIAYGPRRIGLPEDEVQRRVSRALEVCKLGERLDDDPFLLGKGERQRLAVAAVLALEPEVLILDEPTTGLDHVEQLAVVELLVSLYRAGRTVVVITHAAWLVAEHATRAVLLDAGRVLFDGPVPALFREREALARASFVLPEAVELGLRLGIPARSPDELVGALAGETDRP